MDTSFAESNQPNSSNEEVIKEAEVEEVNNGEPTQQELPFEEAIPDVQTEDEEPKMDEVHDSEMINEEENTNQAE